MRTRTPEELERQLQRVNYLNERTATQSDMRLASRLGINTGTEVGNTYALRNAARNNPSVARELERNADRYAARNNRIAGLAGDARRQAMGLPIQTQVRVNASQGNSNS